MMSGTLYVIEKLGATLAAAERQIAEQAAEIERLKAELTTRPSVPDPKTGH